MSKEAIQTIHLKESVSESGQFNSCIVTFNNTNIKLLYPLDGSAYILLLLLIFYLYTHQTWAFQYSNLWQLKYSGYEYVDCVSQLIIYVARWSWGWRNTWSDRRRFLQCLALSCSFSVWTGTAELQEAAVLTGDTNVKDPVTLAVRRQWLYGMTHSQLVHLHRKYLHHICVAVTCE